MDINQIQKQELVNWAQNVGRVLQTLCAEANRMDMAVEISDATFNLNNSLYPTSQNAIDITTAQSARIRDLVSENVRYQKAIEGLLNAYAPHADWKHPEHLQSDVRRAGECLGYL